VTDHAHSVKQVAAMLGIRTHGVLAMIHNGQLRAVDVSIQPGGRPHWRILADDLEGFLLTRTRQPAAPRRRRRKPLNVKAYF